MIENSLRWPTFCLMAREDTRILGVLPLAWQKSWMFGSFLTSLPFLNCGGVAADSQSAKEALVAEAIALAQQLRGQALGAPSSSEPRISPTDFRLRHTRWLWCVGSNPTQKRCGQR